MVLRSVDTMTAEELAARKAAAEDNLRGTAVVLRAGWTHPRMTRWMAVLSCDHFLEGRGGPNKRRPQKGDTVICNQCRAEGRR